MRAGSRAGLEGVRARAHRRPSVCPPGTLTIDRATGAVYGNVLGACSVVGSVTGSGAANRVTFWSSASALSSDAGFTFASTVLTAPAHAAAGTGGAGYFYFKAQSSNPSAPADGFRVFADSSGRFSWRRASDGFVRTFDATLSADRVFTLPDSAGTFVLDSNTQTVTGKTMRGPDGSASAPTYSFSGETNTGWYRPASGFLEATVTGTRMLQVTSSRVSVLADTFTLGSSVDTFIVRDGANIVAQRNGASGQTFRLYNTYTDASNNEFLRLNWSASAARIFTDQAGTGSARDLMIGTAGSAEVRFFIANSER